MSDNKRYFISYSDYPKTSIVELLNTMGAVSVNALPNLPGFVIATLNDSQVESLMQNDKINSVEQEPEVESEAFFSKLEAPVPLTIEPFFSGRIDSVNQILSPAHVFHAQTLPDDKKGQFGLGLQDESDFETIDYTTYYTGKNVDIVVLDVYDSFPGSLQSVLYSGFDNNPDMLDEFGNTRVRNVDWSLFGLERPWNVQQTVDSAKWTNHSMQVASAVAGRISGFAKDANVYVLHLDGRGEVDTTTEALEAILQWAQQRPINEETGRVNDLVSVNSWGSVTMQYYVQCDAIETLYSDALGTTTRSVERGSWQINDADLGEPTRWDVSLFKAYGAVPKFGSTTGTPTPGGSNNVPVVRAIPEENIPSNFLVTLYTTAFQNLVASGVFVFKAAGNDARVAGHNSFHSKSSTSSSYFILNDPTGERSQRWESTSNRGLRYWPGITSAQATWANETKFYPNMPSHDQGIEGVIYIGAMFPSNSTKRLTTFSSRGPFVDLYAQGQGNFVSWTFNEGGDGFGFVDGTSFSCPLVAGIAACNVEYLREQASDVDPEIVLTQLKSTSVPHVNLFTEAQNIANVENYTESSELDLKNLWTLTRGSTEAEGVLTVHPYIRDVLLDPMLDSSQGMAEFPNSIRLIVPPQILDELSQIDELTPKAAEEPAPVPKIFFGLNINNSLSEVQSESKALANLDLDINDLDVIRGIRDLGVSRDDFQTISGLDFDVRRELSAVKASYDYAFNSTITDLRYPYNEFSLTVDGPLSARGYKYKYVDNNNDLKIADVSTSRISSWSSFDDADPVTPIYYGGDLEITKNPSSQKSTITSSRLNITSEPDLRRYASEIPTDIVVINIDGVDREVYAMRGIPLTFEGIFRRAFAGSIGHKIVKRVESDPLPTWTIQNNDDGKLFEFEDVAEDDFIQFFDFRTKQRTVNFYYNPAQIEELSVAGIRMRELPQVTLNNLKKLNVENNDFLTIPDIQFIAPILEELNISSNNLMRTREFIDAKTVLGDLPATLKVLRASGTVFTNSRPEVANEGLPESIISSNILVEVPDFSYLQNLESLTFVADSINDIRLSIADGKGLPNVYSNYVDNPIIRLDEAVSGVPYRIVESRGFLTATPPIRERVFSDIGYRNLGYVGDKIMFAENPASNNKLDSYAVEDLPLLQRVENDNSLKEYVVTDHGTADSSVSFQFLPSSVLDSVNLETLTISQNGAIVDVPYELYTVDGDEQALSTIMQNKLIDDPFGQGQLGLRSRLIPIVVSKKLKSLKSESNRHNFINVANNPDLTYYEVTSVSAIPYDDPYRGAGEEIFWGHRNTDGYLALTSEGQAGTSRYGLPVSIAKDYALDVVKPWENCPKLESIRLANTYCSLNLLSGMQDLQNVKSLELVDIALWNRISNSSFNGSFQIENLSLSSFMMGGEDTSNYPAPISPQTFDKDAFKPLVNLRDLLIGAGVPSVRYNKVELISNNTSDTGEDEEGSVTMSITSDSFDDGQGFKGPRAPTPPGFPTLWYNPYDRNPSLNYFRDNELIEYRANGNNPIPGLIDKHVYYLHYLENINPLGGATTGSETHFTLSKTMYGQPISLPTSSQIVGTHSFIAFVEATSGRAEFRASGIVGECIDVTGNSKLNLIQINRTSLTSGVTNFEENEQIGTIDLQGNLFSQPVPQFTSNTVENIILRNNNFYASTVLPMPILTCRKLRFLDLGLNCIGGRIPTFAGCPSLSNLDLSDNNFDNYAYLAFSNCTQLVDINLSNNKLTRQNLRQIIKDLYATYAANPRKFVKLDLSGNNVSLNEILADVVANKYYNVLTKIASWSIVI